jgi:hypothetical protein
MRFRRSAVANACLPAVFLIAVAAAAAAAPAVPSLDGPDLAKGPYSSMHMLLQKTILKVNVATIDVRVDPKTQGRLTELARGKSYSDGLGHQLALAAIDASRAVVQMQFKRDVSLDRWIGVVKDNLEQARKAGLITAEVEKRVGASLPEWFGALRERGYEKGDRLIYAVTREGVRSVVVSTGGQVLVDRKDADPGAPRVVLGSYFATGSEFREPLLRSLFEAQK